MRSLLVTDTLAALRRSSDHPLRVCEHLCAVQGNGPRFLCVHHLATGLQCLRCGSRHLVAGHRLRLDAPTDGRTCDGCGLPGCTVEVGTAPVPMAGVVVQCPDGRLAEMAGEVELYGYTTCERCRTSALMGPRQD